MTWSWSNIGTIRGTLCMNIRLDWNNSRPAYEELGKTSWSHDRCLLTSVLLKSFTWCQSKQTCIWEHFCRISNKENTVLLQDKILGIYQSRSKIGEAGEICHKMVKKNVEQLWICLELTDLPDIEDVEEWPSRGLQKLWRLQNQKWHGEGRAVGDSFGNPLCDRNWETHKKGRMDEAKSRKIQ